MRDDINETRPTANGSAVRLDTFPSTVVPQLSIIVPTRDEAENVGPLLDRIVAGVGRAFVEVLFVDDSDDDTPAVVQAAVEGAHPVAVRLLHRHAGERRGGLGGAVVEGLRQARGDWAVVMDGDLQHPPELAVLLADVGRSRDLDLVVATRHTGLGDAAGLSSTTRPSHTGWQASTRATLLDVRRTCANRWPHRPSARYNLARRLEIDTHIHALRHYSATGLQMSAASTCAPWLGGSDMAGEARRPSACMRLGSQRPTARQPRSWGHACQSARPIGMSRAATSMLIDIGGLRRWTLLSR